MEEKIKTGFKEIPLAEICANPRNPRKSFSGKRFDELVASIKQKGVIEPIIVRPMKGNKGIKYEIVAGERRYWASMKIKDGLPTIPAIVRDISADEAFDFMIIENLQREDLTEFEEAESFKAYLGKHGDGAEDLAEKTGISPQYIRRRVAVLGLPDYILTAWRKGKIRYGHLEQFLRIDDKGRLKELLSKVTLRGVWDEGWSVEQMKREIDREAPALSLAYFDISAEGCSTCPKNSKVQMELFGLEQMRGAHCLDPKCFKQKQNDWLQANWKESPLYKKHGTTGFRFSDNIGYNDHSSFYYGIKPDAKCKECKNFLSVIDSSGQVSRGGEQECFNKSCMMSRARSDKGGDKKKERKPGEPRVSWHGEYFRDVFLMKRIPEAMAGFAPASQEMITVLLVAALHGNNGAKEVVGNALEIRDAAYFGNHSKLFKKILGLPYSEVDRLIPEAVKAIVMEGQHVGEYSGFGTRSRYSVARFLGVDLAKEYAVDDEYLQKKTRAEIIGFLRKSGIYKEKKLVEYLAKHFKKAPKDTNKLKKSELVELVMKSGVKLVGRVPDEILAE